MKILLKILFWVIELYMDAMDKGGIGFFIIMSLSLFGLFLLGGVIYKQVYCQFIYVFKR